MPVSENARAVLEKRYLLRDENGTPLEDVEGMFRRVCNAIAEGDAAYGGIHARGRHHAQPVPRRDLRGRKYHVFPITERRFLRQHHARVLCGGQAFARQRAFARAQSV